MSAADLRDAYKPLLADVVMETLGNDTINMSDNVLDNLLLRSDILRGLFAMAFSTESNDRAGRMSGRCSLLTFLGNARSMLYF